MKIELPNFNNTNIESLENQFNEILINNKKTINNLITKNPIKFSDLIFPLQNTEVDLERVWSVISHLNSVCNTKENREIYNRCLQKLTDYQNEIGQNKDLYHLFFQIKNSDNFLNYDSTQQKIINDAVRDFHLSGVSLSEDKKVIYKNITEQLAKLSTKFEENLIDATDNWNYLVANTAELDGLPDYFLQSSKQKAEAKEKSGYLMTLDFPSFHAVMTFAKNRKLREIIYRGYVTRASDQGKNPKLDNSSCMVEILNLKQKLAKLLDLDNYADLSLKTKMAKNTDEVMNFLHHLANETKFFAQQEILSLKAYAKDYLDINDLQPWDVTYVSEQYRMHLFQLNDELLRSYFPLTKVLEGLFEVISRLYQVNFMPRHDVSTWHQDVMYYDLINDKQQIIGGIYLDLFAREQKRGGAWMDHCKTRYQDENNQIHLPVAFVVCNFSKPAENELALLNHDEVQTLFHEFGHALHHLLTKVNYYTVSGINGVPWDGVELPSQFMENWCWQKESLPLISCHFQTKESLPENILAQLINAKNFQSGMQMMRQLEFSLFDFSLHLQEENLTSDQIQKLLNSIREQYSVVPVVPFNRFQHGFSHIFAGGYAAGYYSYKWAEVLSADAFGRFEETSIFDQAAAQDFLHCILEKGGSESLSKLFIEYRGREPNVDALLKQSGLVSGQN